MPSTRAAWRTPPEVRAWARGMRNGEEHVYTAAAVHWAAAGDVLFSRSQEYVHVITGNLKASGRQRTYRLARGFVAEIAYGGGAVDYAGYEEARGGDHAYLSRAVETSTRLFDRSMGLIFETAMERSKS